jgi:methyl-accepting chemotaxis protein
MSELLKIFPPYLIFLTIFLVFIPTIAAAIIRIQLYRYLQNLSEKTVKFIETRYPQHRTPILDNLERRFELVIDNLEAVNTAALVEGIYGQEKFSCFGQKLRCEQWDYFCRLLPNLLLAFGLGGTFLGITINLYNLSQTISLGGLELTTLVEKLKVPLQSMGIAFITSLIGLVCSSLLLIINLRYNTNIVKYQIVTFLEDYLDNVFRVEKQGETRLDKAVTKMTQQQEEFLTRFRENVANVLETTLGRIVNRIADENAKANQIAIQVYERLLESSGTIDRGANTFNQAALSLERQVEIVSQTATHFEKTENAAKIMLEAALKIEQSKFIENLEYLTRDLAKTQTGFTESTLILRDNLGTIVESNKKATHLAEQVYLNLNSATESLQNSAIVFAESAETIKHSEFPGALVAATADLKSGQQMFADSLAFLEPSTQTLNLSLMATKESALQLSEVGDKMTALNLHSSGLISLVEKRLGSQENKLIDLYNQLNNLIDSVKEHQNTVNSAVFNLAERLAKAVLNSVKENNQKVEQVSETIDKTINEVGNLVKVVSQEMNSNNQKIGLLAKGMEATRGETVELINGFKKHDEITSSTIGNLANKLVQLVSNTVNTVSNNSQKVERIADEMKSSNAEIMELVSFLQRKNLE